MKSAPKEPRSAIAPSAMAYSQIIPSVQMQRATRLPETDSPCVERNPESLVANRGAGSARPQFVGYRATLSTRIGTF
jgi:hypothetical protein